MKKKRNIKLETLIDNITYRIIGNTIYLFQDNNSFLKKEWPIITKKLMLIIEDNDISYINISARKIDEGKKIYQDLGFTLSYYDVEKLRTLYPNKKNKMDYRCYGLMTKSDFINSLQEKEKIDPVIDKKIISSNKGYVSNSLLFFGGIILLCYFCLQGVIYLAR